MRQTVLADLNLSPCTHCGKPLGDNTITDQRGVWHESCYVEVNQPRYEGVRAGMSQ